MKHHLIFSLTFADVPYPAHLVCNQGTVVYSLEDRNTPIIDESNSTVCPPYHTCAMWRWDTTDPMGHRGNFGGKQIAYGPNVLYFGLFRISNSDILSLKKACTRQ